MSGGKITIAYLDGAFWLIPYAMRPGQSPAHISVHWRYDAKSGPWIWMGSPGWWGTDANKARFWRFVDYWRSRVGLHDGCFDEIETGHESLNLIDPPLTEQEIGIMG